MKLVFLCFSLIAIFCIFTDIAPAQPTSLNMESLVGKVKRIDEEIAEMKLKKGVLKEGSSVRSRTIIFDKKGQMTYRWWKIEGITSATETFFSYEKDNNRIQRTLVIDPFADSSKAPNERLSRQILRFEVSENALYEDIYIGKPPEFGIQTQKNKYIFGSDNLLLERIDYTTEGVEVSNYKYVYGTERLPLEQDFSAKGSKLKQTLKFTYTLDAQGNWTKRVTENTPALKDAKPSVYVEYRKIEYYK